MRPKSSSAKTAAEQAVNDIRSLTMFSDSQTAACSNTPKSDHRQLPALALKVPGKERAYAVDLIIVPPLRKARELDPQILQPRRLLRQPRVPSLDAGRLRMEPGDLVVIGQECRGIALASGCYPDC